MLLTVDGVITNPTDVLDDLPRSVIISLFSWRRANKDDVLSGTDKFGWWGDTYADQVDDKIGSRFWLLLREKILPETTLKAIDYAKEALQWLIDDGIATDVQIQSELQGLSTLAIGVIVIKGDNTLLNIRFADVWNFLNV